MDDAQTSQSSADLRVVDGGSAAAQCQMKFINSSCGMVHPLPALCSHSPLATPFQSPPCNQAVLIGIRSDNEAAIARHWSPLSNAMTTPAPWASNRPYMQHASGLCLATRPEQQLRCCTLSSRRCAFRPRARLLHTRRHAQVDNSRYVLLEAISQINASRVVCLTPFLIVSATLGS